MGHIQLQGSAQAMLLAGSLASLPCSLTQQTAGATAARAIWKRRREAPWCSLEVATLPAMCSRLTSHPRQEPSQFWEFNMHTILLSPSFCLSGS